MYVCFVIVVHLGNLLQKAPVASGNKKDGCEGWVKPAHLRRARLLNGRHADQVASIEAETKEVHRCACPTTAATPAAAERGDYHAEGGRVMKRQTRARRSTSGQSQLVSRNQPGVDRG
jgi:hypothetical protein